MRFSQRISPPNIRKLQVRGAGGKLRTVFDLRYRVYFTDGTSHRAHTTHKSNAEALGEYTAASAAVARNEYGVTLTRKEKNALAVFTLADAAEEYQRRTAVSQAPTTHDCERLQIVQLLKGFGADTPIADITAEDVRRYIAKRKDKPTAVRHEIGVLGRIFKVCHEMGIVGEKSPVAGIKLPRKPTPEIYYLSADEASAVMHTAESLAKSAPLNLRTYDAMIYPYCVLSIYTGARPCELARMRWYDIDFNNGIVTIRAVKTEQSRVMAWAPAAVYALQWWRQWLKDSERDAKRTAKRGERIADRVDARRRVEQLKAIKSSGLALPCFESPGEKPDLKKALNRVFIAAIGRKERAYIFRHTFATLAVLNGAPANIAQRLLGHSTLAMTTRYTRIKNTPEVAVIEAISQKLGQNWDKNLKSQTNKKARSISESEM